MPQVCFDRYIFQGLLPRRNIGPDITDAHRRETPLPQQAYQVHRGSTPGWGRLVNRMICVASLLLLEAIAGVCA